MDCLRLAEHQASVKNEKEKKRKIEIVKKDKKLCLNKKKVINNKIRLKVKNENK